MTRATFSNLPHRLPSWVGAVLAAAVLNVVATSAAAQDTTGVGATSDAQGAFRIGELRSGAYR